MRPVIRTPLRLASAVRDDWARALLAEFAAQESKLFEDLLVTTDPVAAGALRGRIHQLRDTRVLITQIGEING
jgi:hypothetical protein